MSTKVEEETGGIIAVSAEEAHEFGCPHCGYRSSYCSMSGGGGAVLRCGECDKTYVALGENVMVSFIGFGSGDEESNYPKLQAHPRRGTPSHGKPDERPEGGGEFFSSRGVGMDYTPGCFVCGGQDGMNSNISAFVQCREAGERVVALFNGKGARLDYRKSEPDYIQVKVGACKEHVTNLQRLHDLTRSVEERVITAEIIAKAIVGE